MRKSRMIVALLIAFMMVFTVVLAACEDEHVHEFSTEWTSNDTYHWHQATCEHSNETSDSAAHAWDGDVCSVCKRDRSLNDYRLYIQADLKTARTAIGTVSSTIDAQVKAAYDAGMTAIEQANTVAEIQAAFKSAKTAMANCVPYANGIYDLTGKTTAERTEILGILEEFAVRTGLTGTTLFENGGYVMYNERVTLGTERYIPGYGFGTLAEGSLSAPLEKETNPAWKMYWHSISASHPGTLNYLNDKGSEVSDFYSYIAAAYFTNFMNETKDGYDWVPELAVSDPVPVGELNAVGQTRTWKFELRQDLKYNTLGKRAAKYDGRAVALEDFITPFKLLLNGKNALARGEEMTTATGASAIPGAKAYWDATSKSGTVGIVSDDVVNFSETVGIKVYEKDGKWWFEYTLGAPVNAFYARYYIDSSLYMPVPEEFINDCGWSNDGALYYLGNNADKTYSPVDNSLSLGSYTLESWTEQEIVYKKNPYYVHGEEYYKIAGVHIQIFTASQSDSQAAFNYFLNGNTDSAGIPYTLLDQYKTDPRTKTTTGDSCFKLNMNALDAETWVKLFGVNGTVAQTPAGEYWQVEPALSNSHFRSALSYALNRFDFAASKGSVASVNFFSSNYMSDPENGLAYDLTEAHENAIAGLVQGTDGYGYSLELARDYFRIALRELEASGAYTPGTKANPTVINLEVAWQYPVHEAAYHDAVKQYWEDAFNDESVTGGLYRLNVEFWVGTQWSDVYYNKMMVGQYDIGFGSISGNSLDPLSFMNVLSSDQVISGNFTLNWGVDTNNPDADILVYDGLRWSYDALYKATQEEVKVAGGALVTYVAPGKSDYEFDEARENLTAEITLDVADGVVIDDIEFVLFGMAVSGGKLVYSEWVITEFLSGDPTVNGDKYTYKLVIPTEALLEIYPGYYYYNTGIDVYVGYTVAADGVTVVCNYEEGEGFLSTFSCELAGAYGLSTVEHDEEENTTTVTLRMRLIDGLSPEDLAFEFGGYDINEKLVYSDLLVADEIIDDGDGVYTFVFILDNEYLAEIGITGDDDLDGEQYVDAYLFLDDTTYLVTAEWNITFVPATPEAEEEEAE